MSLRDRLNQTKQGGGAALFGTSGSNTGADPQSEANNLTYKEVTPVPSVNTPSFEQTGTEAQEQYELVKTVVHKKLVDGLNITPGQAINKFEVLKYAQHYLEEHIRTTRIPMSRSDQERLVRELDEEIFGLGPLEPLMRDPSITDILVNGPKHIFYERSGKLHRSAVVFRDNAHVMHVIDRIVSAVGRRVDEKTPMVDARLKDGSRLNAIIPPLAIDGPSLSIRKFRTDAGTLEKLLAWGSITAPMATLLETAVKCRFNIIVSGGTGSGKTTLLNSLSAAIPSDERIVTIEDSAELKLQQEHVVRLETRPPNIEGEGAISIRQLVINALRMRPDRVVVGECRGGETLDMLQAMNTGHDGSLTTLHANSPRDALSRIETMCLMNEHPLPESSIRQQISSAVHLIVHAARLQDGSRRVTSISEVTGMEGAVVTMQEIFKFEQTGIDSNGKVLGHHIPTGIRPSFSSRCESMGVTLPAHLFDPKASGTISSSTGNPHTPTLATPNMPQNMGSPSKSAFNRPTQPGQFPQPPSS